MQQSVIGNGAHEMLGWSGQLKAANGRLLVGVVTHKSPSNGDNP
jgi:hypothetical protein